MIPEQGDSFRGDQDPGRVGGDGAAYGESLIGGMAKQGSLRVRVGIRECQYRGQTWYEYDLRAAGLGRHRFHDRSKAAASLEEAKTKIEAHGRAALRQPLAAIAAMHEAYELFGQDAGAMLDAARRYADGRASASVASAVDGFAAELVRLRGADNGYAKTRVGLLRDFARSVGDRRLDEVDFANCLAWITGVESPETRKTRKAALGMFFRFARRSRLMKQDPLADFSLPRTQPKQVEAATVEQLADFLRYLDESWPRLLDETVFGGLLGIRPQELRRQKGPVLLWEDVDRVNRVVTIRPAVGKGGRGRRIPYEPWLDPWLAGGPAAGRVAPRGNRETWARLRRRIRKYPELGSRYGIFLVPNVLRHTYCSMEVAKWGVKAVSELAGNSVRVLRRHYVSEMALPNDRDRLSTLSPVGLGVRNLGKSQSRPVSARPRRMPAPRSKAA